MIVDSRSHNRLARSVDKPSQLRRKTRVKRQTGETGLSSGAKRCRNIRSTNCPNR